MRNTATKKAREKAELRAIEDNDMNKLAMMIVSNCTWPTTLTKRTREGWLSFGRRWTDQDAREEIIHALKGLGVPATVYARLQPALRAELISNLQWLLVTKAVSAEKKELDSALIDAFVWEGASSLILEKAVALFTAGELELAERFRLLSVEHRTKAEELREEHRLMLESSRQG